ncbi:MAG: SDR family oxidoreductase [Planctomycetes bacterium]|nr:SDR family oxidoreductase [Planctomycetota bacterium]
MKPVALITGGASGIGLATARRLASDYDVTVVDRRPAPETACIEADVRDAERAEKIVQGLSRLDVLVTCAGLARDGSVETLGPKEWKDVLDVNLIGTVNYLRAAATRMKWQHSGKIVAVSSTTALRARRHLAAYAASKAALMGLVRAAARDLGPFNINVNAVAPGLVETPMGALVPEEIRRRLLEETPLGRFARPEDVAAVIAFLCHEDARHITGEIVRVDGGQLA